MCGTVFPVQMHFEHFGFSGSAVVPAVFERYDRNPEVPKVERRYVFSRTHVFVTCLLLWKCGSTGVVFAELPRVERL